MGDRIPTAIERASAVEPFSIRDDYAILTVRIDGGVSTTRGPCAAAALTPAPVSHRAAEPPGHGRFYPSETTIAIQFTGADERTEQRSVRPGNECRFLVRPPHHFGVGETSAAPIRAAAKLREHDPHLKFRANQRASAFQSGAAAGCNCGPLVPNALR